MWPTCLYEHFLGHCDWLHYFWLSFGKHSIHCGRLLPRVSHFVRSELVCQSNYLCYNYCGYSGVHEGGRGIILGLLFSHYYRVLAGFSQATCTTRCGRGRSRGCTSSSRNCAVRYTEVAAAEPCARRSPVAVQFRPGPRGWTLQPYFRTTDGMAWGFLFPGTTTFAAACWTFNSSFTFGSPGCATVRDTTGFTWTSAATFTMGPGPLASSTGTSHRWSTADTACSSRLHHWGAVARRIGQIDGRRPVERPPSRIS